METIRLNTDTAPPPSFKGLGFQLLTMGICSFCLFLSYVLFEFKPFWRIEGTAAGPVGMYPKQSFQRIASAHVQDVNPNLATKICLVFRQQLFRQQHEDFLHTDHNSVRHHHHCYSPDPSLYPSWYSALETF